MYRKYTTSKTNIINTHNYLIQGQSKDTRENTIFHQILVANQYAPLLLNEQHLQNYIGQNQNQNVVSQNKGGFQTYFDGNLIQIKIKQGIKLLTDITSLDFNDILELVNAMNLDYALAIKQILANKKYKQKESLSHCCKFYEDFILREENGETIVPFLQVQSRRIHYYDIHFGSVFPKHQKPTKSETPKHNTGSNKKLKLKNGLVIPSTINQPALLNEQTAFKRYLLFLGILFSAEEPTQIIHNLKNTIVYGKLEEQYKVCIGRLSKKSKQMPANCLFQLLVRCLAKSEEYNIHIFQKQCELLKDKYLKLKNKTNCYESSAKDPSQKDRKHQSIREDKQKVSKSMITPSSKYLENCMPNQANTAQPRRISGRLKYSKSQIKLNKSGDKNSFSQGRKVKKATLNMFKDSKIQPSTSLSTLIQQTTKNVKKEKINNQTGFGFSRKSFNLSKMSLNSTNWLNYSSIKDSQVSAQLRNFKKGNNFTSAHISPQAAIPNQSKENTINQIKQQKDQAKDQIVDRFSRSKGLIMKKQEKLNDSVVLRQSKQQTQDQFTMTEEKDEENNQIANKSGFAVSNNQIAANKSEIATQKDEAADNKSQVAVNKSNVEDNKSQVATNKSEVADNKSEIASKSEIAANKSEVSSKKSGLGSKSIINTLNIKLGMQQRKKDRQMNFQSPKLKKQPSLKKQSSLPKQEVQPKKQAKRIQRKSAKKQQKKLQAHNPSILINKPNDIAQPKVIVNNPVPKTSQFSKKNAFQIAQNSYLDQIQQVGFKQKQKPSLQDKKQIQKSKEPPKLSEQQKTQNVLKTNPVKAAEPRKSVNIGSILQQSQKVFYKKHFQLILTFFKQNLAKINTTPHMTNLVYLINILYYKNMIQTFKSQSNLKYKQLSDLIVKKQLKIPQQMKKNYLIFRIGMQQMYESSRTLIQLQNLLNRGTSIQKIQKQVEINDEVSSFVQISEQACLLIDQILAQMYVYIQTNKAMLINKDLFGILLQLGYLVSITRIICGQRLNYYKALESYKVQNIFKIFSFQFKKSEDQYLAQYQKKIADKDMTFFNVIQELTSLKAWIERFA